MLQSLTQIPLIKEFVCKYKRKLLKVFFKPSSNKVMLNERNALAVKISEF